MAELKHSDPRIQSLVDECIVQLRAPEDPPSVPQSLLDRDVASARVFVNNPLNLAAIDVLGCDYDFTL
jgi:hypothetical protein